MAHGVTVGMGTPISNDDADPLAELQVLRPFGKRAVAQTAGAPSHRITGLG